MPRSQTPVVSQTHHPIPPGTAAFHPLHGVGFPPSCKSAYPGGPRLYLFRGSITRPVFSLPPASYTPLLESHADSLLTCWLAFGQVGLEPYRPSPTGYQQPISWAFAQFQGLGFTLARAAHCYAVSINFIGTALTPFLVSGGPVSTKPNLRYISTAKLEEFTVYSPTLPASRQASWATCQSFRAKP